MRIVNYLSLIAFFIAFIATASLIFTPIIQWNDLVDNFLKGDHDFLRLLLEGFNFWGSKAAVRNGLQFFLAVLLICYITILLEVKRYGLPQFLILIVTAFLFLSFMNGTSFFKFSSIISLLLMGLALLSKNRIYSVALTSLSLMSNISIALPSGIILCAADQYREYKFIFRPRFFLVMIDAGLLALILFIATFLFVNNGNL